MLFLTGYYFFNFIHPLQPDGQAADRLSGKRPGRFSFKLLKVQSNKQTGINHSYVKIKSNLCYFCELSILKQLF